MRIANKTIFEGVKYNLASILEELNKANEIVATGKRITDLSDDPVGLTQTLNIRSTLSNIEQLGRNISRGNSYLSASESALTHVEDIISDIKALCVQMASATTGSTQRASAAETVQNMLEEIVSLANTDVGGNYIFSGSKADTAPFSQDGTYNGDDNAFTVKVGKDDTVEVGSDGSVVFGNIFGTMTDLKTALEANDVGGIQDAISNLDVDFDHISAKISYVGSRMARMEVKDKIFQDLNFTNADRLSKIEDADMAEAIIDLKSKELTYQAALASSARVMGLSLLDYL